MSEAYQFSLAILPFLKTSQRVSLGSVAFRSTADTDGLPAEQATAVSEIAEMLFLQNHLRIERASYAVVPWIDLDRLPHATQALEDVQAVIAYLYSTPHQVFGTPFLHSEHASMIVFTPATVSKYLLDPGYNVVPVARAKVMFNEQGQTRGYSGLYNFRHHFWTAPGSRVYGPMPHPVLNMSQDLYEDVDQARGHVSFQALFRSLSAPRTPSSGRVLTALRWYNSAHRELSDEFTALIHLAIALEALLGLPATEKTDRLVDAISLLLGRVPRLDQWARQFYEARSAIVHEGASDRLGFVVNPGQKGGAEQEYQSLFSYGSQVFRLCLGTLLVGAKLAEEAGLEERFITNQERFTALCQLLNDKSVPRDSRVEQAEDLVDVIERYEFLGESGLRLETMLGAVRASLLLMDSGVTLGPELSKAVKTMIDTPRAADELAVLSAVRDLSDTIPATGLQRGDPLHLVSRLVKVVWSRVLTYYFWLERRTRMAEGESTDAVD